MAMVSGTATDYLDLLDQVRSYITSSGFLATQAWTVKRWQNSGSDSGAENELILLGSGLSGGDEIYVGVSGYYSVGGDYYNWRLNAFTGFDAGRDFDSQLGAILSTYGGGPVVPMWNSSMTYWLVANGRRIILVTKVSGRYEAMYLGFILPYATPTQFPYPVLVGGSLAVYTANRWSEDSNLHRHFVDPITGALTGYSPARLRKPDGTWGRIINYQDTNVPLKTWPYNAAASYSPLRVATTLSGDYTLFPILIYEGATGGSTYNVYGELDGCYWVTGWNNAAENVITISGDNYLVVQNVYRTGLSDYWALKLS